MDDLRKHHVTIIGIVAIVAIVAIVLGIFEINTFRNEDLVGFAAKSCTDSDGGINYTVQGTVKAGTSLATDSCSGSILTEYYCNTGKARQTNPIGSQLYNCTYGCSNGACLSSPSDTTPPTISITSPASGATVSGTITVSASASDNVGVIGVQFKLDGLNLWAEVTSSPYSVSWDTTTASNTVHTLSATARDAAGNFATSIISVTVSNNVDTTPPVISNGMPVGTLPSGTTTATLSVTTNENANCKYSTIAGVAYSSMANTFSTTGGTFHSTPLSGLTNGNFYNYYVRCQDLSGNADVNDYLVSFNVASSTSGNIINAASCSQNDVQIAINASKDGDTVQIPAGTCTWDQTVTVGVTNWNTNPPTISSKAITIQGAGMDKTVIIDNVPTPTTGISPGIMLKYLTKLGGLARVTGLTFDSSVNLNLDPGRYNVAMLQIGGYSQSWRVDHVHFIVGSGNGLEANGFTYGVADHNTFNLIGWHTGLYVYHPNWGGQSFGDGSWSDDLYLGTEKAVYIEDNVFNGTTFSFAHDGWSGERIVFRHNALKNAMITNHGTESSGRLRGARSFEIYDNTISYDGNLGSWPGAINLRSGAGVIYNNQISGAISGKGIQVENYRDFSYFVFEECDGASAWDVNDGIIYETGINTGSAGKILTDSTKNWIPNQWIAYSVHDLTSNRSSIILSNTNNTISAGIDNSFSRSLTGWNTSDVYNIQRATICLDQFGRGRGDLLSGGRYTVVNTVTGTKSWPHQAVEPFYQWGNTLNGAVTGVTIRLPHIVENRDFYNTPMPGYTPYTYPHPLTATG